MNVPALTFITLPEWKKQQTSFFFRTRKELQAPRIQDDGLKQQAENILSGKYVFFSSIQYMLGTDYDWVTNPDTGYQYDINKHWSDINDYAKEAGDIKFVWEKSRFSFLYTLIRYDYHFEQDMALHVLNEIENWIDANPVNLGPNYKCSQEISLRTLNWTFALHYYKDSPHLTPALFNKIVNSIYWQVKHVYSNINFSRIAVRNNHAITESLVLYLIGLLYPFFPEAKKWKQDGKKWFEKEIAYQIYPDGTFLQFSMNYHRVVIQLLSWAIRLAHLNSEKFSDVVYGRANASLDFLNACMNENNGHLPNYGANDGALFFPLNNNDYRDYRPQLEVLSGILGRKNNYHNQEDKYWYGLSNDNAEKSTSKQGTYSFTDGGYYLLREKDALTFLRCGNHKDRPSQADNLHLDVWVNGENILRDAGSYKYNADEETLRFFFGTGSHNTVTLGEHDQMLKGGRFIWYYWSGPACGEWKEFADYYEFTGSVHVFKQLGKNIVHKRLVKKYKNELRWEITDEIKSSVDLPMTQIWNPYESFDTFYQISAVDKTGRLIEPVLQQGWYSPKYGEKIPTAQIRFTSSDRFLHTVIEKKTLRKIR